MGQFQNKQQSSCQNLPITESPSIVLINNNNLEYFQQIADQKSDTPKVLIHKCNYSQAIASEKSLEHFEKLPQFAYNKQINSSLQHRSNRFMEDLVDEVKQRIIQIQQQDIQNKLTLIQSNESKDIPMLQDIKVFNQLLSNNGKNQIYSELKQQTNNSKFQTQKKQPPNYEKEIISFQSIQQSQKNIQKVGQRKSTISPMINYSLDKQMENNQKVNELDQIIYKNNNARQIQRGKGILKFKTLQHRITLKKSETKVFKKMKKVQFQIKEMRSGRYWMELVEAL